MHYYANEKVSTGNWLCTAAVYLFSDAHYSLTALFSDPVVATLNVTLRCSQNGEKKKKL